MRQRFGKLASSKRTGGRRERIATVGEVVYGLVDMNTRLRSSFCLSTTAHQI